MEENVVSVSQKGQITLPVAIRKHLGLMPKDKVSIRIEDGKVVVDVEKTGFLRWYQSVPALKECLELSAMTEIAAEESLAKSSQRLPGK